MDMSPDTPHAIWGFNGTERPGAVYQCSFSFSCAKGIQPSGDGHDVQEADDTEIPADVKEKILRYARASNWFDATPLISSMGRSPWGLVGLSSTQTSSKNTLGMRNESADMTELLTRRIDRGIMIQKNLNVP